MGHRRHSRRVVGAVLAVLLASLFAPSARGAVQPATHAGSSIAGGCAGALNATGHSCHLALLTTAATRTAHPFSLEAGGGERPVGDRITVDVPLDARPTPALRPPVPGAEPGPHAGSAEVHRVPATGRAARPPPIAP